MQESDEAALRAGFLIRLLRKPVWLAGLVADAGGYLAQAAALGAQDYQTVMVPHPIQPLTRDEVRALADKAFDAIVARLTTG